jgi:hypothetical protein
LKDAELSLCQQIWEVKKDDCFEIGNELIRLITCLHDVPKLRPITDGLMQLINNKPLFQYLEEMRRTTNGRNEFIASLIPQQIEKKILFMLSSVPQDAYMPYLKWL